MTAVAGSEDLDLAVALAERAQQPREWYGLGRVVPEALTLVLVRGSAGFESVSRGRIPAWGAGLAVPAARLVAIRVDGEDPFRVLNHELGHLVLHQSVRSRVPLWFNEGYAVVAAGEFDRLDALRLNLTVARGDVPSLPDLDAGLRGAHSTAEASYALAATAVTFLARKNPSGTLAPLLERIGRGIPFDTAVAVTTGLAPDRFEDAWRKDVKRRHGLVVWLAAGGLWALVGSLVVLASVVRRRRDRPRRAALDQGWYVAEDLPGGPADADPGQKM